MPDIVEIDHVHIGISDMESSETFHDRAMKRPASARTVSSDGDPHIGHLN